MSRLGAVPPLPNLETQKKSGGRGEQPASSGGRPRPRSIRGLLIARQRTFRRLASEFLDNVFDGAVSDYLVHALADRKLSSDELDELEALIAEARVKRRNKPKRQK